MSFGVLMSVKAGWYGVCDSDNRVMYHLSWHVLTSLSQIRTHRHSDTPVSRSNNLMPMLTHHRLCTGRLHISRLALV